jgi:hypothetical protein
MTSSSARKLFEGKWSIVEMELWDREALDLVVPAYFSFEPDRMGEFRMIAVSGAIDWQHSTREGKPAVEFSWEGEDEGDAACGRGWALLDDDGKLHGRLYFHRGDDSSFIASRSLPTSRSGRVSGSRRPKVR